MSIFLTSDTHFGHDKIIEYCKRPFATSEEMNEAMITRWNAVVKSGDDVYHLGDFGCGPKASKIRRLLKGTGLDEKLDAVLSQTNGNK